MGVGSESWSVVYTWVNGADPGYQKVRNHYSPSQRDLNPERFRDDFQLLRYSLRSLERFLPQVREVILLTMRPQVPDWLNADHPRLRLVHHDQVIAPEYLPTFSPNVIESFLHRIPGLGEEFLYMNDDFLFGAPVDPEVFKRAGRYTVFNTLMGENLPWRIHDGYLDGVGLGLIEHAPMLIPVHRWAEAMELKPDQMHRTRANRFRQRTDLFPYKLYRYHMLRSHRAEAYAIPLWEILRVNRFHKLTNDVDRQQRFFDRMRTDPRMTYCLNDDLGPSPDPRVADLLKTFLEERYPDPSSFERGYVAPTSTPPKAPLPESAAPGAALPESRHSRPS